MKFLVAFLAVCTVAYGFVPKMAGRIVGGEEVEIENFPFQVSVRYDDDHICGGSILDQDTILTSAHCVYFMDREEYGVRVGNTKHKKGTYHKVAEIRRNEDYNPEFKSYDMAILKLDKKISFTETTQPVELQPRGVEVKPGTVSTVSGWGVTSDSNSFPDNLHAADVSVISEDACSKKYQGLGIKIVDSMLCAHTLNKDTCNGDRGSPLVADGRLIGVASWGKACASPDYPGIYAKVSDMYDWIQDNRY